MEPATQTRGVSVKDFGDCVARCRAELCTIPIISFFHGPSSDEIRLLHVFRLVVVLFHRPRWPVLCWIDFYRHGPELERNNRGDSTRLDSQGVGWRSLKSRLVFCLQSERKGEKKRERKKRSGMPHHVMQAALERGLLVDVAERDGRVFTTVKSQQARRRLAGKIRRVGRAAPKTSVKVTTQPPLLR